MATLGSLAITLQDWASRVVNQEVQTIIEILNATNEILEDMVWMEGNLATGHKTTIRSGLPSATWRLLNYGVPNSKAKTVQVTDTCGMLEAYGEVDKSLADLNGDTNAFRLSEDKAHIEGMSQTMATTIFYGNTEANPEKFMGFAPRYNSLTAENAENIINAGGTGSDNTSVWLVTWGDDTCHGIFPKGQTAGLQFEDLGRETLFDADNNKYEGYRSHYKWDAGLTLKDWRYVVRIANVDISNLTKDAATGADLVDLMTQAVELLPTQGKGKPIFYCNKTIKSYLRRQIKNSNNVNITMDQVGGKHVMMFDDIPVKKCDALLNTETAVS